MIFENIHTGEKVEFKPGQDPQARTAHIASYLNSSDMSPNALKGQDFGWRLSPEIKHEVERIKGDMTTLDSIARRIGVGVEDIRDFHILNHIAEKEFAREAMAQRQKTETSKHEQDYNARLEKLRQKDTPVSTSDNDKIEEPNTTNKKGK